jgi:hypothetical protein
MSKLAVKNNPILRSQQVLNALIVILRPYLPLDLRNTRITAEDIIAVLGFASVHRISMDAACNELKEAPSGNRLREVGASAVAGLPKSIEPHQVFEMVRHDLD